MGLLYADIFPCYLFFMKLLSIDVEYMIIFSAAVTKSIRWRRDGWGGGRASGRRKLFYHLDWLRYGKFGVNERSWKAQRAESSTKAKKARAVI